MNKRRLLLCLLMLLVLTACGENGVYRATLITEGEHRVRRGESLEGLLLLAGGTVRLEESATATGPVYILDGTLSVEGEVERDVAILGGALRVGPQARLGGALNVGGGTVTLSPDAVIVGGVVTSSQVQLPLSPGWTGESRQRQVTWFLVDTLGLALLAAVLARFLPRRLARVRQAAAEQPVATGAFGVLVGLVAPALLVLMAFTIILIPLAFLGLGLLVLATVYGLVGVGTWVGELLGRIGRRTMAPPVQTFVGTAVLMLVLNATRPLPLLGGTVPLLAMAVGLGAALLTRFGGRRFVPAIDRMPDAPGAIASGSAGFEGDERDN